MQTTIMLGGTGSGKTEALKGLYRQWVGEGVRTDQILVLTAGAVQSSSWRRGIDLPAHGPIEAHSFFGFIQRELSLWWATIQAAQPSLGQWIRPEFLNAEIGSYLMQGLLEPFEPLFTEQVKASPRRIAIQIAANLATTGAAAGLSPTEVANRLAASDRPGMRPLYDQVESLLTTYRERCLAAGLLDFGLALDLFTGVLLQDERYRQHLHTRFRRLLVDDLDESAPAAQVFLAALAAEVEQTVLTLNPEGGHSRFMGADPLSAYARLAEGARVVELGGSHTCSPALYAFGQTVANRISGSQPMAGPLTPIPGVVEERIIADLWSEMLTQVTAKLLSLIDRGVAPGQIAIITPWVDRTLLATISRALSERPQPIPLQTLADPYHLLDQPYVRAIITLAGLVQPGWQIPLESAGPIGQALQLVLGLDPIRAALLGDAIWQAGGAFPDLDEIGLRQRIGVAGSQAYEYLRRWVEAARQKEWPTDGLAQAILLEVMAPLIRRLTPEQIRICQQLVRSATRFRQALDRLGEGAYGQTYIRLLSEGTLAVEPFDVPAEGVILATPYAYLSHRLSSQYQIWVDISSSGWYRSDVKELSNPHILSQQWVEGERWSDHDTDQASRAYAARTARALLHRCTGGLILAESALNPWGQEQEGGLSDIFVEGGSPS